MRSFIAAIFIAAARAQSAGGDSVQISEEAQQTLGKLELVWDIVHSVCDVANSDAATDAADVTAGSAPNPDKLAAEMDWDPEEVKAWTEEDWSDIESTIE